MLPRPCGLLGAGADAAQADAAAAAQQPHDQAPLLSTGGAVPDAEAGGGAGGSADGKQWTAYAVAAQLQGYLWAVALDFLVTLAVFPGVASSICPSQNVARRPPCTPHPHAGRFYGELPPVGCSFTLAC